MESGTIKRYSEARGEGIIVCDRDQKEIPVSHSAISCDGFKVLHEGQKVLFEIAPSRKGPAASNVVPCDDDE